jgi:hypothetical protein
MILDYSTVSWETGISFILDGDRKEYADIFQTKNDTHNLDYFTVHK